MTKEIEKVEVEEEVIEKVKEKGREETIIKYAFITFGVVLVLSIIAFIVISSIPVKVVSIGKERITEDEFIYYYKHQADMVLEYKQYIAPDMDDYAFLMSEYTNGVTYSQTAAQRALGVILETYVINDLANGDDESYIYDKEELEEAINSFKQDFENYASEQSLKVDEVSADLYGCTYKSLLKAYEMAYIASKYQDDKIEEFKKSVTDEQKAEYYTTFKEELDSVTVRHILIASFNTETGEEYTEDQINAAKVRAELAYSKALEGQDFVELAIEYSEDPSVTENEGLYQFKKEETQLVEFAEWSFSAEEGDIGFITSTVGFHVIQLIERTDYTDLEETVLYNIAYGEMLKMLEEIEKSEEYEIGYFDGYYNF